MTVEVGGWLMLLGIFGSGGFSALLGHFIREKTPLSRTVVPLASLGVLVCSLAALVMVFQGFHLWNQGWDVDLLGQMDPSQTARLSARSRGRGGIVLLAAQFFPQFLVFGYGVWLWMMKPVITASLMVLGVLKRPSDT